jgi:hypothetical protein
VTVRRDAPYVHVTEARQDGDRRVRAKRVRRARTLLEQRPRPRSAKGHPVGVGVVDGDTDQPPRAHDGSERVAIRLGVSPGAVAKHDGGEWSAAARLQQDALEIDGRTVQRADERPRCPGCGLGIPGD